MGDFVKLDPLLHSELRLAVMSTLLSLEEADFVYLREATGATAGNLSVQLDKLSEAGYITVEKGFVGRNPRTVCRITQKGRGAFAGYVEALKSYLRGAQIRLRSAFPTGRGFGRGAPVLSADF